MASSQPVGVNPPDHDSHRTLSYNKCLVTSVALLAIGAAIVGILGLVATPTSGLGALSVIPMPVSGLMTALGGLGILFCIAAALRKSPKKATIPTPLPRPHQPKSSSVPTSDPTPVNPKSANDHNYCSCWMEQYQELQPVFKQEAEKVLQGLNIQDLESHLNKLYSGSPTFPELDAFLTDADDIDENDDSWLQIELLSFSQAFRLLLLSNEEIMSLKMPKIQKYDEEAFYILNFRLSLIEEQAQSTAEPKLNWNEIEDPHQLTLGQLRQIRPDQILTPNFRLEGETIKDGLYCLFTSQQVLGYLQSAEGIDQSTVDRLLPTVISYAKVRTESCLQSFDAKMLKKCIQFLSTTHLRLFTEEQFMDPSFPWVELAKDQRKFNDVLSPFHDQKQRTQRILQSFDIPKIKALLNHLSRYHLLLLSDDQLMNPSFPWVELAKDKVKFKDVLSPFYEQKQRTQKILQSFDIPKIKALLNHLSRYHLLLLSDEQLMDANFPWGELAKDQKKFKDVLYTFGDQKQRTQRILRAMSFDTLKILKPNLSTAHQELLSETQKRALLMNFKTN